MSSRHTVSVRAAVLGLRVLAVAALVATATTLLAQTPPPGGSSAGLPPLPAASSAGLAAIEAMEADDAFFKGPTPPPEMLKFRLTTELNVLPAGDWPVPSKDPRNFEGTWRTYFVMSAVHLRDMWGHRVPLNAAGRELLRKRVSLARAGKPPLSNSMMCLPPGPTVQMAINNPIVIHQNKDWLQMQFEQYHGLWIIPFEGTKPIGGDPRPYMGRSVSHWDGNTLVVETTDYKRRMWLDINGTPVSPNVKFTHRISKVSDGPNAADWRLNIITTVDDPTYYTRKWDIATQLYWRPDKQITKEYDCEYAVNQPDYVTSSGFVPDPEG